MCHVKTKFLRMFSLVAILLAALSLSSLSFCMENKVNQEKVDSKNNNLEEVEQENKFFVNVYSEKDEFCSVFGLLELTPFFKSNGYDIDLPKHKDFKDLWDNPEKIKNVDKEELFKIFSSKIYKKLDISPVQKILKNNSKTYSEVLGRFKILNKKWGFKIFSKYEVITTMYGPGGRYNWLIGRIELLVDKDGKYCCRNAYLIIHEAVHIGIEELIVQKFKLSHWEKEGLVDLICKKYLGDLLPGYEMQSQDDKRIIEFVKSENICDDLLETMKQYVLKYPRDVL